MSWPPWPGPALLAVRSHLPWAWSQHLAWPFLGTAPTAGPGKVGAWDCGGHRLCRSFGSPLGPSKVPAGGGLCAAQLKGEGGSGSGLALQPWGVCGNRGAGGCWEQDAGVPEPGQPARCPVAAAGDARNTVGNLPFVYQSGCCGELSSW